MILLDGAPGDGGLIDGHPGDVQQAVEQCEVGKEFFLEDASQIEFQKTQLDEAAAVAEQTELLTIGDEGVEVLGEVEVFLHERVR